MKASLPNLRISPRKVRLAAGLMKGKPVSRALAELALLPKRSAAPLYKLIKSAAANASGDKSQLTIKNITVNEAPTLKRYRPRAHGRAFRINKRGSRVSVELS